MKGDASPSPTEASDASSPERLLEYRSRGDYHRELDPDWSYTPIYRRKMIHVEQFMGRLSPGSKILDAGAGEGVLVERFRDRGFDIIGVDAGYDSELVRRGDLASLPFPDDSFDAVLCLDVLEHLPLLSQEAAVGELARVTRSGALLLLSVPNLAHLHSRVRFALSGRLTRTSALQRHPGDRPLQEFTDLVEAAGFAVQRSVGVFPTLPGLFRLINRRPARYGFLLKFLDRLLPFPGWCFLGILEARKI